VTAGRRNKCPCATPSLDDAFLLKTGECMTRRHQTDAV
jgi:hypothetical protein